MHFRGDIVVSTVILALRGKKQFKPSSLAIGGLEFVIFCSTLLFYLFLDQAAKILGEKKKNVHVS